MRVLFAGGSGLFEKKSVPAPLRDLEVREITRLAAKTPSSPYAAYDLGGPPTSLRGFAAAVERFIPVARRGDEG